MAQVELKAGDRVAFSRAWLRSTGHFTGEVPFRRGTVREVRCFADSRVPGQVPDLCVVAWDDGSESRALACNLVRVDRIPFEPV